MKPKILLLLIFLSFTIISALKAQDIQTKSVDPAPFNPNIVTPGIDNSQMIGSRYWTFVSNGSSLQFGKGILESCSMTNLGSPFTGITPGALANKNGTLLMNNQSSPFQVYAIDTTTGGQTLLFSCTGVPQANMTGMTWDPSTSTLYGISTSLTVSQIFTINTTTGVCTPIGSPSTVSPEAVFICSNYAGRLFSADVINDNFYRWNKVTGAPGLIGPLGIGLSGLDQDAAFDFRDGNLYVIAHTGGASQLYRVDTNGVSTSLCSFTGQALVIAINAGGPEGIIHNQNEVPKNYSLSQNYPNPFNPTTLISFGLPKSGNVKLVVYDILGREAKILVDEFKQAGSYNIEFDASSLASGVYFYRLESGDYKESKKMLIIK